VQDGDEGIAVLLDSGGAHALVKHGVEGFRQPDVLPKPALRRRVGQGEMEPEEAGRGTAGPFAEEGGGGIAIHRARRLAGGKDVSPHQPVLVRAEAGVDAVHAGSGWNRLEVTGRMRGRQPRDASRRFP
jgi:hypothetical protein